MHPEVVEPFATPVGIEHGHLHVHVYMLQYTTLDINFTDDQLWVTTCKVKNIMEAGWDTGMEQACSRCSPCLVVRPSRM